MPALLIAGSCSSPSIWRSGVYTIPEFLGRRYNEAVRFTLALCWGLILVTNLAIMLYATSVLLGGLMGWNPLFSIWLTVVVIGIYTIGGGLGAVVMTDVLQVCVMFVGGAALAIRAVWEAGGLRRHARRRPRAKGRSTRSTSRSTCRTTPGHRFPGPASCSASGIVLSTAYFSGNRQMVQRALGARTEWDAKAGVVLAGLFKLFIPLLVAIPGLAALVLLPDLASPDDAVPSLMRVLLPPACAG